MIVLVVKIEKFIMVLMEIIYLDYILLLTISMLAHHKLSYSNELFIQGQLFTFFSYLAKSANVNYKVNKINYNPYVVHS